MSKSKWEVMAPVISTAHVTKALDDYLRLSDPRDVDEPMMFAPYYCGYFIFLPASDYEAHQCLTDINDWLRDEGYPDGWVRIDRDGDTIEGLPTYNW